MFDKLRGLARLCIAIGLLHPVGPTCACIVSLATLSSDKPPGVHNLLELRDFKNILRGFRKSEVQGPDHYPETPEEFKTLNPEFWCKAYSVELPIVCPVSFDLLMEKRAGMACRSTKTGGAALGVHKRAQDLRVSNNRWRFSMKWPSDCPPPKTRLCMCSHRKRKASRRVCCWNCRMVLSRIHRVNSRVHRPVW